MCVLVLPPSLRKWFCFCLNGRAWSKKKKTKNVNDLCKRHQWQVHGVSLAEHTSNCCSFYWSSLYVFRVCVSREIHGIDGSGMTNASQNIYIHSRPTSQMLIIIATFQTTSMHIMNIHIQYGKKVVNVLSHWQDRKTTQRKWHWKNCNSALMFETKTETEKHTQKRN